MNILLCVPTAAETVKTIDFLSPLKYSDVDGYAWIQYNKLAVCQDVDAQSMLPSNVAVGEVSPAAKLIPVIVNPAPPLVGEFAEFTAELTGASKENSDCRVPVIVLSVTVAVRPESEPPVPGSHVINVAECQLVH